MIPVAGNSDRATAIHALTFLDKIVGNHNFYLLIIWSTHAGGSLEASFREAINADTFKHLRPVVAPISLSKAECVTRGEYSPSKINGFIKQKLGDISNYTLLTKWETTINEAISEFLSGLLSDSSQQDISQKLHALAKAFAGKNYEKDIAKHSLLALNDALKGSIDGGVIAKNYSTNNRKIDPNTSALSEGDIAKINQKMMLNPELRLGPGCVFKASNSVGQKFSKNLLIREITGCINIKIDITPICDIAQDKNEFSYYVHGLLVPKTAEPGKGDYIYAGLNNFFLHNDQNMKLVLNLRTLEAVPKRGPRARYEKRRDQSGALISVQLPDLPKKEDILFKLRDNIVIDIQHKVTAHNARPGHVLL
jgi:hypothetical protein